MEHSLGTRETLTSSLRRDHEVILKFLDKLEVRLNEWHRSGTIDPRQLRTFIDFAKTFTDKCHHGKEERCLFPCLERKGIPRENGPIGVMLYEHELGRQMIRSIELLLDALGAEKSAHEEIMRLCGSYIELLRQHIDKENGILFPMGEAVADEEDVERTNICYEHVEHVDVGHHVHERLKKLAEGF